MDNYYFWMTFNLLFAVLPCLVGAYAFTYLDKVERLVWYYVLWLLVTESFAYYFAFRYRNNMPVYNISAVIQVLLISCYLTESNSYFKGGKAGLILGGCGLLAGILNLLFFQPLGQFPEGFVMMQGIMILSLSVLLIIGLVKKKRQGTRSFFPHFYIASALILVWLVLLVQLSGYNQRLTWLQQSMWLVSHVLHISNALFNAVVAIVFFVIAKRGRHAAAI